MVAWVTRPRRPTIAYEIEYDSPPDHPARRGCVYEPSPDTNYSERFSGPRRGFACVTPTIDHARRRGSGLRRGRRGGIDIRRRLGEVLPQALDLLELSGEDIRLIRTAVFLGGFGVLLTKRFGLTRKAWSIAGRAHNRHRLVDRGVSGTSPPAPKQFTGDAILMGDAKLRVNRTPPSTTLLELLDGRWFMRLEWSRRRDIRHTIDAAIPSDEIILSHPLHPKQEVELTIIPEQINEVSGVGLSWSANQPIWVALVGLLAGGTTGSARRCKS